MRWIKPFALAASVLFLSPLAVSAQQAGAPRPGNGGRGAGSVTVIINNNAAQAAAITQASSFNFFPVPGLGFDMVHLAATRGAAAVGAAPGPFSDGTIGMSMFTGGVSFPPRRQSSYKFRRS